MRKDTKRSLTLKTHTLRQLTASELMMVAGGTADDNYPTRGSSLCQDSGGANCSYENTQDGVSCGNPPLTLNCGK